MSTFIFILFMVLAVLAFLYGVFIFLAASGTAFFLVWIVLAALFTLCALAVRFSLWAGMPFILKGLIITAVSATAVILVITFGCMLSVFHSEGEPDLDYLIVLGAQVRKSGPSNVLKYRLDTAVDYLKGNPDTVCIVSGGQGYNEPSSEAFVMKEYLVDRGVDENRILMEDKSENTHQNIEYNARLCSPENDRIGIVTNNFHIFRAVHLARKAGYRNVCGIAAPVNRFYLLNNMLRESFGIMKDFLRGNLA